MAIVKVIQQPLLQWSGQLVMQVPKPRKYQRRIQVHVPDEVVKQRLVQPVLDAYAVAINKPEWVGKPDSWYKEQQQLMLGFKVLAHDDGTPVEDDIS